MSIREPLCFGNSSTGEWLRFRPIIIVKHHKKYKHSVQLLQQKKAGEQAIKAYIIYIELQGSDPLIWRRVVMPAGATYKRLHDIIQNVTNFQSGYPHYDYHLYEFALLEENIRVTNDEEAYQEHIYFKKHRKEYEERLGEVPPEVAEFEKAYMERLKITVRKPASLKIDDYLEKHEKIAYTYDFGDNWVFIIKLEEIVDDYYFGYPTLLAGAETAPPEDVGGLHGYYEFLEAYWDEKHPGHKQATEWAVSLWFKEYDPDWINEILKYVRYKKTEWDKIKHDNYKIIEDKYRRQ